MKYKILKSIAHNFSHSFVSYTNYIDNGPVIDDLLKLVRKADGERISIQWIPESPLEGHWPPRVLESIASYREWCDEIALTRLGKLTMVLGLASGKVFLARAHDAWAAAFEQERARIIAALGEQVLEIQHVGSTSIPNEQI